jgi:histone-lysine N-methyltransferase MLL2
MFAPSLVSENVPVPPVVGQLFAVLELLLDVVRDELVDDEAPPVPPDDDESVAPVPPPEDVADEPPEGVPDVVPPEVVPPDVVPPDVAPVPPALEELPRAIPLPNDVPEDELPGPLEELPVAPSPLVEPQPAANAISAQGPQERRRDFIGDR